MAVIDTLNVNLQASTAGLAKGLKSGTSLVSGFASSLKAPLAQISALFAGAFSANAMKDFVLSAIDAADEMEHVAEIVGVTAEAFNQLRHAAALSDVTQGQLVSGLERMERTLGDAGQGSESAAKAFERIGLSVDMLKELTPDRQFKMIATAIAAIKDPSEKAAAAVDIFGKSGQNLIPLLNQGEQGLNALGAEVKNAFSEENRKGLKEANDAIDVMNEAFKSMAHETAIALAPTVKEIAEVFKEWLKTLKEIIELIRVSFGEPLGAPQRPKNAPPEQPNWNKDLLLEALLSLATGQVGRAGQLFGLSAEGWQRAMAKGLVDGWKEIAADLAERLRSQPQPGVEL